MLRHVAAGELVVDTTAFPLKDAAAAWTAQQAVPHGKIVLRMDNQ
jgi:hypothetical protein